MKGKDATVNAFILLVDDERAMLLLPGGGGPLRGQALAALREEPCSTGLSRITQWK